MDLGRAADMRIVPLGSGVAVLDLDWFLNYRDAKLVIQASEVNERMIIVNIEAISAFGQPQNCVHPKKGGNCSVINVGKY